MKNKAFTLTEVLITIGLIGIVAALTLPALMKLNQEAGIGPLLAKAQNTIEEGVGRMLVEDPDTTISDTTIPGNLSNYIIMTADGNDYRLKDGIKVTFSTYGDGETPADIPTAAGTPVKKITVDINGDNTPNVDGVDKFDFALTSYGMMMPQGCASVISENNWKVPKDYDATTCNSSSSTEE